jgi:hypothetical protein
LKEIRKRKNEEALKLEERILSKENNDKKKIIGCNEGIEQNLEKVITAEMKLIHILKMIDRMADKNISDTDFIKITDDILKIYRDLKLSNYEEIIENFRKNEENIKENKEEEITKIIN